MDTINQNQLSNKRIMTVFLYLLPILGFLYMFLYGRSAATMGILVLIFFASFVIFLAGSSYTLTKILVLLANIASLIVTGVFYSSWGSIIQYLAMLMLLLVLNDIVLPKRLYKILHLLTFVLLTLYILTIRIPDNLSHIVDLFGAAVNPNMMALLTLAAYGHFKCFLDISDISKNVKVLLNLVAIVGFGLKILQLECRSVMIVFALFILVMIVIRNPLKYKTYKALTVIVMVASLLFVFVYLWLYRIVPNVHIFGKSLFTGRQIIWGSAQEIIKEHIIFGCGNTIEFATINNLYTTTSHNTLVGIWKILGIIPVVSFITMLANKPASGKKFSFVKTSQFFFICSMIICFFESFYTDAALFVFYLLFLPMRIESENDI